MLKNLLLSKVLFIVTGTLSVIAGGLGVLNPEIYDPVAPDRIIPGIFTQDLFVAASSIFMIVLAAMTGTNDIRKFIINCGVLGFLFYAYGIYTIEQIYTPLYPIYLAILSLSFFTLATSISSLNCSAVERLHLPSWVRYSSAGYGVFIAVMFNFIWFSQLIPLLQTGNRIEYLFSVYIIDLVFIMPSFVIAAILLIRNRAVGIVALPALFIVGVGILGPLALAELIKPSRYDIPINVGELQLYGLLTLSFLIFSIVYLIALDKD